MEKLAKRHNFKGNLEDEKESWKKFCLFIYLFF